VFEALAMGAEYLVMTTTLGFSIVTRYPTLIRAREGEGG